MVLIIGILAVLVAAVGLFYRSTQTKATNTDYVTAPVQRGTVESSIEGTGTLQPSERYVLKSWSTGTVQEVYVTEGTPVKKGDPILLVTNEKATSQAKAATLNWELAQSALQDLINPLSEDDYDRRTAELKVEECRISLQDIQEQQDKLLVKAPFDGTILDTELELGQRVNSNVVAATFATTDDVEIVAEFSEKDINSISVGMEADIFVNGVNRTYTGKVKEIAFETSDMNDANATDGTFRVILSMDKPDDKLRAGMSAYSTVYIVKNKDLPDFVFKGATGYIRYTQTEDVVTEVSGTVAEILHQPGDKILKGEPILRLTNDDLVRQTKSAETQLAKAEEDLRKLLSPDADTIKEQQLKVEQSYQSMLEAQDQLDSLNVVSPIDGVVVTISVRPGDEFGTSDVESGQEMVVISNFTTNEMEINVDELDINKIEFGQVASITLDALPGVTLEGKVTGIAQEGTSSNDVTKYPVTLEVGYAEGIKGGMSATATIALAKKENVLRIPAEALTTINKRNMVQVVENGQTSRKLVEIGINNGTWVEIISGLEEGQQVVLASTATTTTQQMMMQPGGMGGMPGGAPPGGTGQQRSNTGNYNRKN